MPTLTLLQAEGLVVRALTRSRTNVDNARSVARALVAAEADGLKGHGLSRMPMYAAQAKVRKVDGFAHAGRDAAAAGPDRGRCGERLRLSGDRSSRSRAARRRAQRRASPPRRSGGRSHCGAAGHPVERLADAGPGRADVRQHAGRDGAVGRIDGRCSAPIRSRSPVRCPAARRWSSTCRCRRSRAATSWRRSSAARKSPKAGRSMRTASRPPIRTRRSRGTMVPMGDAKGTALALMVELLAAGLTGSNFAAEASSYLDAEGPPSGTGQLIIAFDPAAFGGDAVARFGVLAQSRSRRSPARGCRARGGWRSRTRRSGRADDFRRADEGDRGGVASASCPSFRQARTGSISQSRP